MNIILGVKNMVHWISMTGRTHDLAAFTALFGTLALLPNHEITLATVVVAFSANMVGGLAPDIDQPTAELWTRVRAGSIIGKLISPLLGGHRHISHSLVGIFLVGILLKFVLGQMHTFLLVDMNIVWWSFMIGYLSHLVMDTITREGVPWFFPLPFKIGFPPIRFLRVKTTGRVEKYIVFPLLLVLNGFIFSSHYAKFIDFFKHFIKY